MKRRWKVSVTCTSVRPINDAILNLYLNEIVGYTFLSSVIIVICKKLLRKLGILRGILFICKIKSLRYEVNHRIHPFVEAIQG